MNAATARTGACPLCGGVSLATVGPKGHQVYYRCRGCDLIVGSSLWESDVERTVDELYDEKYLDKSRKFHPATTSRLEDILGRIERYTHGRRLFEVGFGNGQFLHTARERGWDVSGVEVSGAACAWASEELALPVRQGLFEAIDIEEQSADAVASMETIEHMYDPDAFVRRAWQVLRPGGILFLTTPNAGCITARITGLAWRCYGDGHTLLFPARRLSLFLERHGFEILRLETRTVVPQAILSYWRERFRKQDAQQARRPAGRISLGEIHETRDRIDANPLLRAAKTVTNATLNVTRTGEKTLLWARKP